MFALRMASLFMGLFLSVAAAAASPQPLHTIIAVLPKGQLNKPYPTLNLVAGGTPPYSNQLDGTLPKGMLVSSAGALAGTPRETGTFRFRVTVLDSEGVTLQLSYVLQVELPRAPERNTLLGPTH
jgi:hypothetical protein